MFIRVNLDESENSLGDPVLEDLLPGLAVQRMSTYWAGATEKKEKKIIVTRTNMQKQLLPTIKTT